MSRRAAAILLLSGLLAESAPAAEKVSFARDVRPLLSNTCFKCHGPDENKRQAELRLDTEEGILGEADSGETIVVPGKPKQSEIWRRLTHPDLEQRMPPVQAGKPLSADALATIRSWIEQGANWEPHWAFAPVVRPPLPTVRQTDWPKNAIDYFVLARLEKEGLQPSPPADSTTLYRRLSLDHDQDS